MNNSNQFRELMEHAEKNDHIQEHTKDTLPERCYSLLPGSKDVIIIRRNEMGYYKTDIPTASKEDARAIVNLYNARLGVSKAQEEAMKIGSMFGWDVPGADPKNYDRNEKPMKPKDRGDAR